MDWNNIQAANGVWTTPATYDGIPRVRKLTIYAPGDLELQVKRDVIHEFSGSDVDVLTWPAGINSRTFPGGIVGFRLRGKTGVVSGIEVSAQ